ncbi:MAG: tetratricopeptide repeat protein [Desulfuromonadaceae bacterium]|nr:tetratricopeptide repeat protein [Desulfuromonadaceae bacterium]
MMRGLGRYCSILAVTLVVLPALPAMSVEGVVPDQQAESLDHKGKIELARSLFRQGQLDEAEQVLQQVITLTPDPEQVYYELGCIHEQRGDNVKAIAAFKEGIRIYEQGRRKHP